MAELATVRLSPIPLLLQGCSRWSS